MSRKKLIFKVKAVIFDMDGVITDTMSYHMKAWKIILANHGVFVTKSDIYKREGQRGIESVREIFAEHDKVFNLHIGRQILAEKEVLFKKIVKRKFIVGSRSFIKRLRRMGFNLALVTGTARHEVLKILPIQLIELFDTVICGCEVQNGKPHPEPYLKALSCLGIKAKDAVVIENAPFGIRSAKSAGIPCLALETSLPKVFLNNADGVFQSFSHINSCVEFKVI